MQSHCSHIWLCNSNQHQQIKDSLLSSCKLTSWMNFTEILFLLMFSIINCHLVSYIIELMVCYKKIVNATKWLYLDLAFPRCDKKPTKIRWYCKILLIYSRLVLMMHCCWNHVWPQSHHLMKALIATQQLSFCSICTSQWLVWNVICDTSIRNDEICLALIHWNRCESTSYKDVYTFIHGISQC